MREVSFPAPGEILLEERLEPMGPTQCRLAREIGLSQRRIGEIIPGKRSISADTGIRLSRFFGLNNAFWVGLQLDHDLEKDWCCHARSAGRDSAHFEAAGRPPTFNEDQAVAYKAAGGPIIMTPTLLHEPVSCEICVHCDTALTVNRIAMRFQVSRLIRSLAGMVSSRSVAPVADSKVNGFHREFGFEGLMNATVLPANPARCLFPKSRGRCL